MTVLAAFRYDEPRQIWGAGMHIKHRREIVGTNLNARASHLQLLLAGELEMERCGQRQACKKGDVHVFLGGEDQRYLASSERIQTLSIFFQPLPGDGYRVVDDAEVHPVDDGELRIPASAEGRTAEAMHEVFRRAQELIMRRGIASGVPDRRFCNWQLQTLLRGLMLTLATRLDPHSDAAGRSTPVQRVVQLLSTHFDHPYTLDELAGEAGVSPATLKRRFKRAMGCTVKQFQQRMRIQQASMWLIEDPDLRLRDLAERLGFHDEFHFSKTFKQQTGQSPSEYRSSF